MTKSDLIDKLINRSIHIQSKVVENAVKEIIEYMVIALTQGKRIEIRGFGSFSLHYRIPRIGRNPQNGSKVILSGKFVPHFKPGKELRYRTNISC